VPVGPQGVEPALSAEFDEVICPLQPRHFGGVGRWYDDFAPTSDAEVIALLEDAERGHEEGRPFGDPTEVAVRIHAGRRADLAGDLRIPPSPSGLIVFAHGSGSSRKSPRNRAVAAALNDAGFATLLLDLLTEREERVRANVFNVELLAERLLAAIDWAESEPSLAGLPVGLFGASTGAAAALLAAAVAGERVGAVVSRGGRPDLAEGALAHVLAPTLLIVGGADQVVLGLNESAAERISAPVEVAVIPGAGHLFEETGALALVSEQAIGWFRSKLAETNSSAAHLGAG
jgi:putative phosphoribosyl transferase